MSRLRIDDLHASVAGHEILRDASLKIAPGSHVAIVGSSGAGKSTLVGLLLGWHHPSIGTIKVDDRPLDGALLERLRAATAWVDPAVQLWNRSLIENLLYGSDPDATAHVRDLAAAAELHGVLERLPDGMMTLLGEGGALVSGGEGQRVRLGRSLARKTARLVILDEPFRGLDRRSRALLLERARDWWRTATLLCVTHDIGETLAFARVLVVEGGQVVEDGAPATLLADESSRYRALYDAEEAVRRALWSDETWRSLWLENGRLADRLGGEGT